MAINKSIKFLVITGLFLAGAELSLRALSGDHKPPKPYLVSDPVFGYRLRMGWSDPSGSIRINSQGFRGAEKNIPQDALLMIGIGSGDTFGMGVSANHTTWPEHLQTLYKKNLPERNIQVMNAGVPGRNLLINLVDLQNRLVRFNPDFILLLADIDHLDLLTPPQRPPQWQRWSLLISAVASRLFPPAPQARKDHWPGEATELLEEYLISLLGVCRTRNIRVVLSTVANTSQIFRLITQEGQLPDGVFPHLTPQAASAAVRSYNEVVRRVALQYQVYLLDSAERGGASQTQNPLLDDEGAKLVAKGFLNITRKMGLHKRQPASRRQHRQRGSIL